MLAVREAPGPEGIFDGLLDRATTRPRPALEDAAEEVETDLLVGGVVPVAAAGGGVLLDGGPPLVVLRADKDREGAPLVDPHAGLEVEFEEANRDVDDPAAPPEAVELRELLRERPPVAAAPMTGEDEGDVPETLLLILAPVGVDTRPRVDVAEAPTPLVLLGVLTTVVPPERKGGGVVLRCVVSSLLGTAGLFAASIATLGNPPEGRVGFGIPAVPAEVAVAVEEEAWRSILADLADFLPGEDKFDLGLTLGRGDTIGPASMLLVLDVVLPGEGRAAMFNDAGSSNVSFGSSGSVRGDGVGRKSLIGSGTISGGGVEIEPEGLEAVVK